MNNKIVGIGEALWDCLPGGKQIGGAPANFAFHVAQAGFPVCAISAVGCDTLGDELISNFTNVGLPFLLPRVPFPTGTVQVSVDDAGIPTYEIKEGVAWDNIPWNAEMEELASGTIAVCFGSLAQRSAVSRNTIRRFIQTVAAKKGSLVVFDVNLRQHFFNREVVEESLRLSNILKLNDEELPVVCNLLDITGQNTQDCCMALINAYHLKALILTCGTDGSHIFTREVTSFCPTPKVTVVDTVGAGDSFTGTFIASLLNGKTIADAHALAVKVSAYVCTQKGAMPPHTADM